MGYSNFKIEPLIKKRLKLFNQYKKIMSNIKGIKMFEPIKDSKPNHWLISFRLEKILAKFQKILNYLNKNKVFQDRYGN